LTKALIIFIKNLIPGKVKTRLAAEVGDDAALRVYQHLLKHTKNVTQHLPVDIYVYYSDSLPGDDIWSTDTFQRRIQHGADLGERMVNALNEVLRTHSHTILIGSDCIDLRNEDIQDAFSALEFADLVIGPSRDGGYYLIGMKQSHPILFQGIRWSTDSVFNGTRELIISLGLSMKVLAVRMDVDTKADLDASGLDV
jgi:rSAM/selenodomain-associated transferase 1